MIYKLKSARISQKLFVKSTVLYYILPAFNPPGGEQYDV
jgi:hypothetical protein